MSLMNWFKRSSNKLNFDWLELSSEEQFLDILENTPQFILFKHSTRCSISSVAKRRIEDNWDIEEDIAIYNLDLIQYRNVSNLIAEKLKVEHQSPQLILVKDGKAVYNASHNGIAVEYLKQAV